MKVFEELDSKLQDEIRDDEIWQLHQRTRTGQTLLDLYQNLKDEFNQYKKIYNLTTMEKATNTLKENEKLKEENERLKQQIDEIHESTSWRVTKPVRWLGKNLKRG